MAASQQNATHSRTNRQARRSLRSSPCDSDFVFEQTHTVYKHASNKLKFSATATQLRYHPNEVRISPRAARYHCCKATISSAQRAVIISRQRPEPAFHRRGRRDNRVFRVLPYNCRSDRSVSASFRASKDCCERGEHCVFLFVLVSFFFSF